MKLRPYQQEGKELIDAAWLRHVRNVLYVLPCGGGKTVIFSEIIREHVGASCAIAHRQELVAQMSLTMARDGIKHRIIGPASLVKICVAIQMLELGKNYYDSNSKCAVASVDTLVQRGNNPEIKRWLPSVKLIVMDEAHHVLENNKWGKAVSMFPNAKGLFVTATPERADGKGLGRHADGLIDHMIEGPNMRDIIDMHYLTDYRIFAPKTADLDLTTVDVSKNTGEYNPKKLKVAIRKSHVIGDVVAHYLRIAPNKLGITFATDIETATDIAQAFNDAGVPAAVVTSKTSDLDRVNILRRFRKRELLQLVNVDLFGEGFDLPAIEVVSMARPTQSYGLYVQQFGRACRLLDGKIHAIIIDHVGNVQRHGLPDAQRVWSLDRREKRSNGTPDDAIPVTTCGNEACVAVYERIHPCCPYCGHKPVVAARSGPEMVDGDLIELDAETLAMMRGAIAYADRTVADVAAEMNNKYAPRVGVLTAMKRHEESLEMQQALRASISWWGGYQKSLGRGMSETYRRFYFMFGIDIMTAQTLKRADAETLANKINNFLSRKGEQE